MKQKRFGLMGFVLAAAVLIGLPSCDIIDGLFGTEDTDNTSSTGNPGNKDKKDYLVSIAVTQFPTTIGYLVGDTFDPAGLVITASYSNNSTKVITGYELSEPDMSTTGTKFVYVSFEEKTTSFQIRVVATQEELDALNNPTDPNAPDYEDNLTQYVDWSNDFDGWEGSSTSNYNDDPELKLKDGKHAVEFDAWYMDKGESVILSRTFTFTDPMVFYFSVKTDISGNTSTAKLLFKLYVDDVEQASYYGLKAAWKSSSIIIPAGSHEIKWVLEKDSAPSSSPTVTDTVWLADISFTPDITVYLDLSPKGTKDTYVGGFPIQYTAKAFRSNGSVRPDVNITFSGVNVSSDGLFTPPTTTGTYRVTASVDGKTVSGQDITVHPADFLRKPYTSPITGKTYNGYQGATGTMDVSYGLITLTYCPAETDFTADGFVTIAGWSSYTGPGYYAVAIEKADNPSLTSSYPLTQNNTEFRVWLRFGPGKYNITVGSNEKFTVTNTCTDTWVGGDISDPRFLYPSSVVQSDDFIVTNVLSHLLFYGVTNEADKIKLIHDYMVQNTVYDYDSVSTSASGRKPQDAASVLKTRYKIDPQYDALGGHYLAVCEGYANSSAALLRAAGIPARYVSSEIMNHGWNNVYTGGSWKFLDVTWDDPSKQSGVIVDYGPSFVRYDYYLLTDLNGLNNDHNKGDSTVNQGRSVVSVPVIPWMRGMPDGWY